MTMADCGLDDIYNELINNSASSSDISEDGDWDDNRAEYDNRVENLNEKQRRIVTDVMNVAKTRKTNGNRLFFVYGKAGCGKTFTFNTLIRSLRNDGLSVIAVASTGIAATLLEDGRTAHSTFSLPLKGLRGDSVAGVDASSDKGKMLREVDVIVWDEISMQTRYAVECVDRLLRDLAAPENRNLRFGGVVMVFGGDWCQFLPVVPGGSKMDIINETLKSSELWSDMQVYVLDENMRLRPGEEEHAAWLQAVGEGRNFTPDGVDIEVPIEMCMESEEDVITWMYTDEVIHSTDLIGNMALLTVRNCDALELNLKVLNIVPGECVEFFAVDTPASEDEDLVGMPCDDEEFIHHLTPPGMPEYKLKVKCGAIVMLLRNIDVQERMCNGTRLEILSIMADQRMLRCRNLLTGRNTYITRIPLDFADENTGIAFRRFQFPIRLSYCMTINKSQGQTFDKVGIIMRTPSFAHGSTYVALSRARSRDLVRITTNSRRKVRQPLRIRNVVYEEMIA
ncbi:unnamed protein product [Cylicostephanus goldi]|uniref:ATP-dependent DNA helicase n=1 Tax=Cylicostephanus goldi TaxID=71465 RepID=A0A3P6QVI9_CYLGO|nr:unnamed protein product [Cylicostephanus goldi]